MDKQFQRPVFSVALAYWTELLKERGLPTECVWVFDENLCFEADASRAGGFRMGYQTSLTPPPPEAEEIGYNYFNDFRVPVVFYRLGTSHGKSICLILGDEWFRNKNETDGYLRREDWLLYFHPGKAEEVEEVTDAERWKKRLLKNRPLHDLDFAMNLRAVHEILAHGRALTSYEHYALRFLHSWARWLGNK
jgi:hypothetical protein